jgi:hypothetical protein
MAVTIVEPEVDPKWRERMQKVAKMAEYQPDDRVRVKAIFVEDLAKPSSITLQAIIPTQYVPQTVDRNLTSGKEFIASLTMERRNCPTLVREMLVKYFTIKDDGTEVAYGNSKNLPQIVKRTHRFNNKKDGLYILKLPVVNSVDKIKSKNLLTDHIWTHEPSRRAIQVLKSMAEGRKDFQLAIYMLDDNKNTLVPSVRAVIERFAMEGNGTAFTWPMVHGANLAHDAGRVEFNTDNLKPKDVRPCPETFPTSSYHDKMEMCTRQALAQIQIKEAREKQVHEMNVRGAVVRVLELTGAGDLSYLGLIVLKTASADGGKTSNYQLDEGDKLGLNFRTQARQIIKEEEWDFTVIPPYPFMLWGEIIGHLVRPRRPHAPGATVEEKKQGKPVFTTKLPVQLLEANTFEEVRRAVEQAPAINCTITYHASVKSEAFI